MHPSKLWDCEVCGLQVTNLTERAMALRCIVISRNASENFDLRCLVREEMTARIQGRFPEAFPVTRWAEFLESSSQGDKATLVNPI